MRNRSFSFSLSLLTCFALGAGCGSAPKKSQDAVQALRVGDLHKAQERAQQALREHPADRSAWQVRTLALLRLGEASQAAQFYRQWTELLGHQDQGLYRKMAIAVVQMRLQSAASSSTPLAIAIVRKQELHELEQFVRPWMQVSDPRIASEASLLFLSEAQGRGAAMQWLDSGSARRRAAMLPTLGAALGEGVRSQVTAALVDEDAGVRWAALSVLASWKTPSDRSVFLRVAVEDESGRVRSRALRALAVYPDPVPAALLAHALTDAYTGVRVAAVDAIAKDSPSAGQRLKELADSEDFSVALRASVHLYKVSGQDARLLLARAMEAEQWTTRAAALYAAAGCTSPSQALQLARRGDADEHWEVRLAAAGLAIRLGHRQLGVQWLQQVVLQAPLESKRSAAILLAEQGEENVDKILSEMSVQGSEAERGAALTAHGAAKVVSEGLINALADPSPALRLLAAQALLRMPPPR